MQSRRTMPRQRGSHEDVRRPDLDLYAERIRSRFHGDLVRPMEVVMDMGSEGLKQVTV